MSRYSLDQIALFAKCAVGHQVKMLEMVLSPVLAASGVEYKPGKVKDQKARSNRTDEEKDRDLLRKLSRAPIGVRVVKGSQKTHADAKGKE